MQKNILLWRSKKKLFSGVEKKIVHSYDVKFRDLFISDVFRVIPALLNGVWDLLSKNQKSESRECWSQNWIFLALTLGSIGLRDLAERFRPQKYILH